MSGTQALRVLVVFLSALSTFILYAKFSFKLDPSSYFFDHDLAYEPRHSKVREHRAMEFISQASQQHSNKNSSIHASIPGDKAMCVGVLTSTRKGQQHFPAVMGSLLEGLTPDERAQMHVVVFITDLKPEEHPSYGEVWLEMVVDQVLLRKKNTEEYRRAKTYHRNGQKRHKSAMDYRYLLQTCYESQTPHVVIIEDDVIATASWYRRTVAALSEVKSDPPWLYLRLFYTEIFLGWRSEEWKTYRRWISGVVGCSLTFLLLMKSASKRSKAVPVITTWTIAVIMTICLPLTIGTYFLAGRLSVQPLSPGLARMDVGGCCSQGMVYARKNVPLVLDVVKTTEHNAHLFPDERIERLAENRHMARWALVPSVLQHAGQVSGDGISLKRTWNMQFETLGDDE